MRLTRRGLALVGGLLGLIGLGVAFGARAIDALVIPGILALSVGALQLVRAPAPALERPGPAAGYPGERRSVVIDVDSTVACDLRDRLPEGLAATASETALIGERRYSYELELRERGVWTLGPTDVTQTDALGLLRRETVAPTTTEVVVYPQVRRLSTGATAARLAGSAETAGRRSFDRLRPFSAGDSLSDINWPASAREPTATFVVAEFTGESSSPVTVTGEADPGQADDMASAVASIVVELLTAGQRVEVVVPTGSRTGTESTRPELLALLARAGAGEIAASSRERADLRVQATPGRVVIHADGAEHRFESLVGDRPAADRRLSAGRSR